MPFVAVEESSQPQYVQNIDVAKDQRFANPLDINLDASPQLTMFDVALFCGIGLALTIGGISMIKEAGDKRRVTKQLEYGIGDPNDDFSLDEIVLRYGELNPDAVELYEKGALRNFKRGEILAILGNPTKAKALLAARPKVQAQRAREAEELAERANFGTKQSARWGNAADKVIQEEQRELLTKALHTAKASGNDELCQTIRDTFSQYGDRPIPTTTVQTIVASTIESCSGIDVDERLSRAASKDLPPEYADDARVLDRLDQIGQQAIPLSDAQKAIFAQEGRKSRNSLARPTRG